jgi:hypothetical protein
MTGNKLTSLRVLHLDRRKTVARKMVKSGVDARTTWWNCRRAGDVSSSGVAA